MAKQKETIFGEQVDKDLKEAFGPRVVIFNIQQKTKAGDPDRIVCIKGKFLALELKTEEGHIDNLQLAKLVKVMHAGGLAFKTTPRTWPRILKHLKDYF